MKLRCDLDRGPLLNCLSNLKKLKSFLVQFGCSCKKNQWKTWKIWSFSTYWFDLFGCQVVKKTPFEQCGKCLLMLRISRLGVRIAPGAPDVAEASVNTPIAGGILFKSSLCGIFRMPSRIMKSCQEFRQGRGWLKYPCVAMLLEGHSFWRDHKYFA